MEVKLKYAEIILQTHRSVTGKLMSKVSKPSKSSPIEKSSRKVDPDILLENLTRHLKDAAEHDKLRSDYDKLKNNLETSEGRFRKVQRLVKSLKEIVDKFKEVDEPSTSSPISSPLLQWIVNVATYQRLKVQLLHYLFDQIVILPN